MTDDHLTDGGKDRAMYCCYNYLHWLKTDDIILITMNIITIKPHGKIVLQMVCNACYLYKLLQNVR